MHRAVLIVGGLAGGLRTMALGALCAGAIALGLAACGGSSNSSSSQPPKEGDCIDAQHVVVSCSSSSAAFRLLSLNDPGPTETACLVIDTPPEVRMKVDGHYFCVQPTK